MDCWCFHNLCQLLTYIGGLQGIRNIMVEEMVAIFLNIVSHHVKNYNYSAPTTPEITALIVGDIGVSDHGKDIIVEHR